jgi:CheY-like chemotaxis protein
MKEAPDKPDCSRSGSAARILVVEDEAILMAELKQTLDAMGFEVVAAVRSGEEAVALVAELTPDIVLMDIQLKGSMDGIEAAETIHSQYHIPVVFLTAYADKEKLERAQITMPFGFLLKPFQDRDLQVTMTMALHTARSDRQRRKMEAELKRSLAALTRKTEEMAALLSAARAILEYRDFEQSARHIFDQARAMTGAASGYIALLSDDGAENEVLFLESGGLPCDVDPSLPMPIRGLREVAYRTGRTAVDNRFSTSRWMDFMPAGHVALHNVMFVPLNLEGRACGLMGLANKPGGFTPADIEIATAFGDLAAIALHNSRLLRSSKRPSTPNDPPTADDGSSSSIER